MTETKQLTAINYLSQSSFANQIKMLLPKEINPARFIRGAVSSIRENEDLEKANPLSVCGSVIKAAMLGVELGEPLGHGYLIPYKGICKFMPGYKGMMALAWRSGKVKSFKTNVICENDIFENEDGMIPKFRHVASLRNRGQIEGFYAYVSLINGGFQSEVMSLEEVIEAKSNSKSYLKCWQNHFIEMGRKTAVRRLSKSLQLSRELSELVTIDETAERNEQDYSYLMEDFLGVEGKILTHSQSETYDVLTQEAA